MSSSSADATAAAAQPGFKTLFTNNSQIENYAKARYGYLPDFYFCAIDIHI